MIGNPLWFSPRKYSGWGLTPNSWQGWAYVIAFILPVVLISSLPLDQQIKNILTIILMSVFIIDVIHIMTQIKKDERDVIHEAIAERNALWFIVTALALGIIYQSSLSVMKNSYEIDPIILIALFGGVIVKAVTNFYLRDK